jgi:hypothetical protein
LVTLPRQPSARPALAVEPHVADAHPRDPPVFEQRLGGREAREHVHAERLRARREDRRELAQ